MDEFSRAKGEVWASQVIERDGKFYSEKICYAMNRSITGPWEYEDTVSYTHLTLPTNSLV